jgi:hypothetical protein
MRRHTNLAMRSRSYESGSLTERQILRFIGHRLDVRVTKAEKNLEAFKKGSSNPAYLCCIKEPSSLAGSKLSEQQSDL